MVYCFYNSLLNHLNDKEREFAVRKDEYCKILINKKIADNIYLMSLRNSRISKEARPGQFVMLALHDLNRASDPLLRRPFSICYAKDDVFYLLYRVSGRGTAIMSTLSPHSDIKVIGPLGNWFSQDISFHILVAGGIGIAPLLFLNARLNKLGLSSALLCGARSKAELIGTSQIKDLLQADDISPDGAAQYVTEDGSKGHKGLVTDYLMELIESNCLPQHPDNKIIIQACGPMPMIRAVRRLLLRSRWGENIRFEASLESVMACGIGLCLGCAVETRYGHIHICKDGPVVNGKKLI